MSGASARQSGHLCLPSMAIRQSGASCRRVPWDHAGMTCRLDVSKHSTGSWICPPRCQSPDVSLTPRAAPHPFPLRLGDTALRNGGNGHRGICTRHMASKTAGAVAAAATRERVHQTQLHTELSDFIPLRICILPSSLPSSRHKDAAHALGLAS